VKRALPLILLIWESLALCLTGLFSGHGGDMKGRVVVDKDTKIQVYQMAHISVGLSEREKSLSGC
jgi:hypothetical protein